ncbi:MAG: hypothetical protein ACPGU7_11210 [Gammaproteobacteria bacterium]
MYSIEAMRRALPAWGRPLDVAVVTGGELEPGGIKELELITHAWRTHGGGTIHSCAGLDEAFEAAGESARTWVSAIAADAWMPEANPIGLVVAVFNGFASADDWKDSELVRFYRQLASVPVVRALIGGDDLTPADLAFFDNGLIDLRLPMNSSTHRQDREAWGELAEHVHNLALNRMSASVPGIWNARPEWLTDPAQNRRVATLLRERGICSWEWITSPNRLRCQDADGTVSWLYIQTAGERRHALTNRRPLQRQGNVVAIAPFPPNTMATDQPLIILDADPEPRFIEAHRLSPETSACFAWTDEEA